MTDINQVILIGRLTRDAELKYTSGGAAISKFAIAVNKKRKKGDEWVEEANFFNIVLWGRLGESLNQYLVKGKQVAVEGELDQNRWTDTEGNNHSTVSINASNVQLLGGGQSGQSGESQRSWPGATPGDSKLAHGTEQAEDAEAAPADSQMDFPDDIPF